VNLNDLWMFSAATDEWTWVSGSKTVTCGTNAYDCNQPGVYGTLGMLAAENTPGGRTGASGWTDNQGNLWLFGGEFVNALNGQRDYLNDLWVFNRATGEWTWMGGSSSVPVSSSETGQPGVYGTLGQPGSGNVPGGRSGAASWADKDGNLWLFGGFGADGIGNLSFLNELWEFNSASKEWAWIGGSNAAGNDFDTLGNYGTLGFAGTGSPGGRTWSVAWTDANGNFWLFGGLGIDGFGTHGYLNDMWEFSPSKGEWTWVSGSDAIICVSNGETDCGAPGIYGIQGTPAPGNTPGARSLGAGWTDGSGNLWLLGGQGYDATGVLLGDLNDLWEFSPATGRRQWAWVGGGSAANPDTCVGVYGTMAVPAGNNWPECRQSGSGWTDKKGDLWLFGGSSYAANGNEGALSDLWEYQPVAPPPSAAAPTFTLSGPVYAATQTLTMSDTTPGTTIYYTTDGTVPNTKSTVYTAPITVASIATIEAFATAPGHSNSPINAGGFVPNVPNFILSASTKTLTVDLRSAVSAWAALNITPTAGFTAPVTFTVTGVPSTLYWTLAPQTATSPSYMTGLTITPVTTTAHNRVPGALLPGSALATVLCCLGLRKRRLRVLMLMMSLSCLGLLNSCGGGGGASGGSSSAQSGSSQPTTAWIVVTATSGSLQQQTAIQLTVN
jgi:hypothetical protein